MKLVECVPNFSEGRNRGAIDAITQEITMTEGVKLLDVDPGADTNRTVVTFIGTPEAVELAAFRAIRKASELIDMRLHQGAHPRIGATDVCPFVPLSGVTMEECVAIAEKLGERVARELGIPVYLYESAARKEIRRNIAEIRKGEYAGLSDKLKDPEWAPDFGEPVFNPRSGATIIGAREFLIAFNVNFNTRNRKLVHDIALDIRERGRALRDAEGNVVLDAEGKSVKKPGLFQFVKAVGWYISEYNMAQLSMNLTNYKVTPPHIVFDTVCEEAAKRGLRVTGAEIVGLIPKEALLMSGRYYLSRQELSAGVPEEELIRVAIHTMGLSEIAPFEPKKKIIEYQIERQRPLLRMNLREFANELSIDSPAPGGGSVAALNGALAAALASMVANLTVGKKGYENVFEDMKRVAVEGQHLKDELLTAIDDDSEAFNRVMNCFRLPGKSEEDKERKKAAIEEATKGATRVPLSVLRNTVDAFALAREVALKGNQNSLSDAGVAGLTAYAAAKGAYFNVLINLANLEDKDFVKNTRQEAERLIGEASRRAREIEDLVTGKLENPKSQ
jgi:glutamate formiminotransferase/formiminotetrahydrofolate cyclodeaminase